MSFTNANELAVLLVGRRPQWAEQTNTSGAPQSPTAGEHLEDAPVADLDVQLREHNRYRRGRITVSTVSDNTAYEGEVATSSWSYTSGGSATRSSVLEGITRQINKLRLSVRARIEDADGDGNDDTVVVESNHTSFHVGTADSNEDYTATINGTAITVSGSSTEKAILNDLADAINNASVPAKAYREDTTNTGDTDTVFVAPVQSGSLDVAVSATGTGSLVLDGTGQESDNPHYGVTSFNLALDADARQIDAVRWWVTWNAENDTPGGWRIAEEWTSVTYRGLSERVLAAGRNRGYLEILNNDEGTIRSATIGPAIEE